MMYAEEEPRKFSDLEMCERFEVSRTLRRSAERVIE